MYRTSSERRERALVTGACSGIGLALAHGLAERGYDLVVVSNREGPLSEAAAEISARYGVQVMTVTQDLATDDAAQRLYESVCAHNIQIDILINNAGIFFFGEAADADPLAAARMLKLHVVTPSLLCTYFAKDMRTRRKGRIMMVSSISAFRDFPGIAYYGSSKKYLLGFARALRSELAVYGVSVTCLLPGATATGLYDPEVVPIELAKKLGVMADTEEVAELGLAALFADQAVVIPGMLNRVLCRVAQGVPQSMIDLARRHAPWLPKR